MSTRLAAPDAAPGPEAVHPVHDQVALNRRRSLLLIASFAAGWFLLALIVLELIGGALLGLAGISFLLAVVFAAVLTYLAVGRAEARILGAIGARPADRTEHARLFNIVDGLCVANGLPEPAVYVVASPAVNALATRRNPRTASVVVTTGLLESLDRMPLEAVVAHQLGRIKTDAAGVGTLVAGLVDGPLLRAVPGTQAGFIRRIIGAGSEARADLDAVAITRYPPGLLAALETCAERGSAVASATRPSAHLWFAPPLVTEPASDPDAARNRVFDLFVPLSQRVDVAREL